MFHDINDRNGYPLIETPCDGCGRIAFHKKCPAHGTLFYMTGIPFSYTDEELSKISPNLTDHLYKAKLVAMDDYKIWIKTCTIDTVHKWERRILDIGGYILCYSRKLWQIVYFFSEEINE